MADVGITRHRWLHRDPLTGQGYRNRGVGGGRVDEARALAFSSHVGNNGNVAGFVGGSKTDTMKRGDTRLKLRSVRIRGPFVLVSDQPWSRDEREIPRSLGPIPCASGVSSDRFEDVDKTRMIDARERIRHRKGTRVDSGSYRCVPMLGYVSFSSLNVSWLLRKFWPSPSDRTSFTGSRWANVQRVLGSFVKRALAFRYFWNILETFPYVPLERRGRGYFRWRKLDVCGNFSNFSRTGKCFFAGENVSRVYC